MDPSIRGADLPTHPRADLACPVCGTAPAKLWGRKTGRYVPREFCFYRCRHCGFLFVDPVTDFAIYSDDYYAGRGPDPLVNYREEYADEGDTSRRYEFANLLELARRHLQRLPLPRLPGPLEIEWLDHGCGAGGLLKYLRHVRNVDWRGRSARLALTGHDVGSYAERLQVHDGFRIVDAAGLARLPDGSFDIISCIEVVEHLPDPAATLERLARLLKPGGLLLLTTGNLACPLARLRGLKFPYCMPEIHVSLFTPGSLSALYRKFGLQPVRLPFDDLVRFRVLKSIPLLPRPLRWPGLANWRVIRRLADFLYGTSAMPCAIKPMTAAAS